MARLLRAKRHFGNAAAVGDDPVLNYIAGKVKVVGQLKESGEFTIIAVASFDGAKESRIERSEVDMSRHDIDEVEMEEDDQVFDGGNQRFTKKGVDQPRRSPIRRKNKLRQEEELKPKAKRNHKRIQQRHKYDWQGE